MQTVSSALRPKIARTGREMKRTSVVDVVCMPNDLQHFDVLLESRRDHRRWKRLRVVPLHGSRVE